MGARSHRRRDRGTSTGMVMLDLAVSLALGGDCLTDVAVVRAEPGMFGVAASDPTVSRLITALAVDAPKALAAIASARAQARSVAWATAGGRAGSRSRYRRRASGDHRYRPDPRPSQTKKQPTWERGTRRHPAASGQSP